MASAEARTTALLFSFSAVALLLLALQPPPSPQNQTRRRGADLLIAALDRFLDGRAVLRLATRTNMVLLCHPILLLILRDAGVLAAPAHRRGVSPPGAATAAATTADSDAEQDACSSAAPRPSARSVVAWQRRPRDGAATNADVGETGRRLVKRQQQQRSTRSAATPALLTQEQGQEERQPYVSSREMVLVDKDHAAAARAKVGKRNLDRRIVVAAAEETVELADDRRIEEFIANQWSMMRQESLQLVRTAGSSHQAITTCY